MSASHRVRLVKSGGEQTVRIPEDLELPGQEALVRRQGAALVLEPIGQPSLLQVLDSLAGVGEDFPDVDEGLQPLRDIDV